MSDEIRQRFEAWARSKAMPLGRGNDGHYSHPDVNARWDGWYGAESSPEPGGWREAYQRVMEGADGLPAQLAAERARRVAAESSHAACKKVAEQLHEALTYASSHIHAMHKDIGDRVYRADELKEPQAFDGIGDGQHNGDWASICAIMEEALCSSTTKVEKPCEHCGGDGLVPNGDAEPLPCPICQPGYL